jgi:hypothetical protein
MTDCHCEQLDPGGGKEQRPDFEIQNGRGERLGILEVTSVVLGEHLAFRNAARRHQIEDPRLRCWWSVVFRSADINVAKLGKPLVELLLLAEEAGFTPGSPEVLFPNYTYGNGPEPEPHVSLYNLGVMMITARPGASMQPGIVALNPPASGGAIGPEMVTEAVEEELNEPGNLRKLSMVEPGERSELFVWLDEGSASAALSSTTVTPEIASVFPSDAPNLPDPVTTVWAGYAPNAKGYLAWALWRTNAGEVWEVLTPPVRLK